MNGNTGFLAVGLPVLLLLAELAPADTLVLKGGERRIVTVSYSQLFDFFAFRDTALGSINLFLRHEAEVGTTQGKLAWLNLIQAAIQRSTTESGQIPSSRG